MRLYKQAPQVGPPCSKSVYPYINPSPSFFSSFQEIRNTIKTEAKLLNPPWVLILSTRKFNGSCSTLRAHRCGIIFLLIQAPVVVAARRQNYKLHISNVLVKVIIILQPSIVIPYPSIAFKDFWATWWCVWCCGCEQPPFLSSFGCYYCLLMVLRLLREWEVGFILIWVTEDGCWI